MVREVIRNNLLSSTSDLLPCQSDRWYAILLRPFEEIIQPGEKAQPLELSLAQALKSIQSRQSWK